MTTPRRESTKGTGSENSWRRELQPAGIVRQKEYPTIGQETAEYFASLESELRIIYQWLLDIRPTYKNIIELQDAGPEGQFQRAKYDLWQQFKNVITPKLLEIRKARPLPRGNELAEAYKFMDKRYNALMGAKEKLLENPQTKAQIKSQIRDSMSNKSAMDEHAKYVKIQNLSYNFSNSLFTFWMAENFRPVDKQTENAFILNIWMEKINSALIQLRNLAEGSGQT